MLDVQADLASQVIWLFWKEPLLTQITGKELLIGTSDVQMS